MLKLSTKVLRNDLGRAAAGIRERAGQVVRKTALDVEADAKLRAAVDTGAMRASIYTVAEGHDGAEQSTEEVSSADPKAEVFDPVALSDVQPGAAHALLALVVVGVRYGLWVERGTARQAPQPFLLPAAAAHAEDYEAAMRQAVAQAAQD